MGVEVQAWGHLGTAPFAAVGNRDTGAGGESPPVLDQGWDLLCTPSGTCEGMAGQLPPVPGQDSARTLLPLTPLFSFPRSPLGQRWGLAAPQPMDSPSSPLWPWRTLLLLRNPQNKTGLPKGELGMGHGPTGLPRHPLTTLAWQIWALVTVRVMKGWQNLCSSCRDGVWDQDPAVVGGKCMGTLLGAKKVWAFQQEKDRQHQANPQASSQLSYTAQPPPQG